MKRSPPLSSCGIRGSEKVFTALREEVLNQEVDVEVEQFKCFGFCEDGPNVRAAPTSQLWTRVSEANFEQIIHFCRSSSLK